MDGRLGITGTGEDMNPYEFHVRIEDSNDLKYWMQQEGVIIRSPHPGCHDSELTVDDIIIEDGKIIILASDKKSST